MRAAALGVALLVAMPVVDSAAQTVPTLGYVANEGADLVYSFDAQAENTGIANLLRQLNERGVDFKDLQTEQSSLEEIFVNLVRARA